MSTLDNPELLNIMLQDAQQAPDIYKPTNYWSVYGQRFLPELQKLGLKDFRRRRGSILSTFGKTYGASLHSMFKRCTGSSPLRVSGNCSNSFCISSLSVSLRFLVNGLTGVTSAFSFSVRLLNHLFTSLKSISP